MWKLAPLWWGLSVSAWLLAPLAIGWALLPSAAARLPRRSPLLRLHVSTLRVRPNAGARPRYAMRGPALQLVRPN